MAVEEEAVGEATVGGVEVDAGTAVVVMVAEAVELGAAVVVVVEEEEEEEVGSGGGEGACCACQGVWEQVRTEVKWAVGCTPRRLGVQQLSVDRATCCRSSSSASLAIASSRFSSSARLHSSNHAKASYSPPPDAPGVRGLAPSKLGTRLKISSSSESAMDASSSFCVCVAHVCRSKARHVTANGLSSLPQALASANLTSSLIALDRM